MKYAMICVVMVTGSAAFAGCSDFEDGSMGNATAPVYRVCFDDTCDVTTQSYVCSNVNSFQAGYAVGWAVDCQFENGDTQNQQCTITWQGRVIDPAKHDRITFTPLDQ